MRPIPSDTMGMVLVVTKSRHCLALSVTNRKARFILSIKVTVGELFDKKSRVTQIFSFTSKCHEGGQSTLHYGTTYRPPFNRGIKKSSLWARARSFKDKHTTLSSSELGQLLLL